MGIFGDLRHAARQRDLLLEVQSSLYASVLWKAMSKTPLFGDGIKVGIAMVDCRRCSSTDAALLLEQTIWGWQAHRVSYSTCIRGDQNVWIAEYQAQQAFKTRADWLDGEWTTFDKSTGEAWVMQGVAPVHKFEGTHQLEEWILGDFMSKGQTVKQVIADEIMKSDNFQLKLVLQQLKAMEGN